MSSIHSEASEQLKTPNGDDAQTRRELDDERRQVPLGWTRAFDRASGHHFYAPTDATSPHKPTWTHPYDNPAVLNSLPADHPANPQSKEAIKMQKKAAEEQAKATTNASGESGKMEGGWLGKLLGKDKENDEDSQAIKAAEASFVRRREALSKGDLAAPGTKANYAADPFAYAAPAEPFSRPTTPDIRYAYGYPEGYGRQYSPVYGYGKIAASDGMLGGVMNSLLAGSGSPVPGYTKKTNYGFSG